MHYLRQISYRTQWCAKDSEKTDNYPKSDDSFLEVSDTLVVQQSTKSQNAQWI